MPEDFYHKGFYVTFAEIPGSPLLKGTAVNNDDKIIEMKFIPGPARAIQKKMKEFIELYAND